MNRQFCAQWLELLCGQLPDVESAIFMLPDGNGEKLLTLATWPQDLDAADEFTQVVQYTLKKREQVCFAAAVTSDQQRFDLFALPIPLNAKLPGVVVVKIKSQPEDHQKAVFNRLRQGVRYLSLARVNQPVENDFYSRIVGLMASCFEQETYQKGLVSMVTELTRAFQCERVAYAEYHGRYNRVVALSNSASFDQRSNLMQQIANAMDEAMDQDSAIIFPDQRRRLILRAHQELARKYGSGSICTIPLINHRQRFGAITLLRDEDHPFDPRNLQLFQQTFGLITPYLALQREQEKNLLAKVGSGLKSRLQKLFGVRRLALKLGGLALIAVLVGGSLVNGEYRITADAVLEGKIQRVVAAPFAGYLLSAAVRAGDTVEQGQVMASLNDSDIRLQLSKLEGELQKVRREYREAQSKRDLVKVRVTNEQVNQINAEIELTRQRLERINLTAPFDGVVIEGDLAQSLGAPLERGEALFKIAPLDGYRIILKVDESDIVRIAPGQQGQLILPSLTGQDIPLTVDKITIAAQADDGANIFRVEASLNRETNLLRPGMQGIAKIGAGRARLIWIWSHEFTDWLRLWFWSWWP
jgi:RND family efflux transporter MFP subunit